MSQLIPNRDDEPLSPQAYLEQERASHQRHEYYAGRVVAMAGASAAHNRIVSHSHSHLPAHLDGQGWDVSL